MLEPRLHFTAVNSIEKMIVELGTSVTWLLFSRPAFIIQI